MSIWNQLKALVQDQPPEFYFEVSESAVAWAKPGQPPAPRPEPLPPETLSVSPLRDNVQRPGDLTHAIQTIIGPAPGGGKKKKQRDAVVILPDYCARVAVVEFDEFPKDPVEQLSLLKFRMKKSVPFDVESALIRYHVQQSSGKKVEVVVVVAAMEIVARYEQAFRAAGLFPGYVTTAALALVELERRPGISLIARLSGRQLTAMLVDGGRLKLVRCVELDDPNGAELMDVLYPTIAYAEDELKARPERLVYCGFHAPAELGIAVEPLQGRFGTATPYNAGLLGYLEATAQ